MVLELDIPSLLVPFGGSFRGGSDLRKNEEPQNLYRKVRDLRHAARDEEKKADAESTSSGEPCASANSKWEEVWENGVKYLESTAKDIEIASYLIEASIRLGGYGGFAKALQLTRELIISFWGELLPTPDENGIEATIDPLSRLDSNVITYSLIRVSLTDPARVGYYVLHQYDAAKRMESLPAEERDRKLSRGAVTLEDFKAAIAETDDEFLRELAEQIRTALSEVDQLRTVLISRAGDDITPGFRKFSDGLVTALDALEGLAGDRLKIPESPSITAGRSTASPAATTGHTTSPEVVSPSSISSRSFALDTLEHVAKWFERHEPQSILPLEIRKVIRRAKMAPVELYAELIANEDVRREFYRDVGIVVPQ